MNLDELKKNHKTSYLADMYEKLQKDEAEVLEMAKDTNMREMAEAEEEYRGSDQSHPRF
jgi:hypothetical protein